MDRYLIVEQDKDTNLIIIKKMVRNYEKAIDYMRKNYKQNIKGTSLNILYIDNKIIQIVPINEKKFNFKMEV